MNQEKCPFSVGDIVVYSPSGRGQGLGVMTDLAALIPGNRYKVTKIERGAYLVVDGFEQSAAGGLHWSEFTPH